MWGRRRTRREQLAALLVLGGLVVFVVLVYVVIVLGGGALIGHTSSPHAGLSVLATAVVALSFGRVQSRLEVVMSRLVHGGSQSPYEVLEPVLAGGDRRSGEDDLPARMAEVLAAGTGAKAAQVWLMVDGRLRLAATWPADGATEPASTARPAAVAGAPGRRVAGRSGRAGTRERTADAGRGTALRRAGRPGRAGTARRAVAGRARASARGAVQARARNCEGRGNDSSTRRTPSGNGSSATSMTALSSIWSRSR